MDTKDFEIALMELIERELADHVCEDMKDLSVRTYEDCGYLTRDAGCVVRFGDEEFQITIVKR